jgi:hypothetical protein
MGGLRTALDGRHLTVTAIVHGRIRRIPPLRHTVFSSGPFGHGHVHGVTIRTCRSKDRVVRLEPFFTKAAVAPLEAGAAGRMGKR